MKPLRELTFQYISRFDSRANWNGTTGYLPCGTSWKRSTLTCRWARWCWSRAGPRATSPRTGGTKQHMVTNVFMVLLLDGNSILDAWETGYMPCVRESSVYNLPFSLVLSSWTCFTQNARNACNSLKSNRSTSSVSALNMSITIFVGYGILLKMYISFTIRYIFLFCAILK